MTREMLLMKVSALANGSIAPQSVMQAIDVYVEAVLSAFVAGEVEGPYDVVAPFEDGPLTRVRHKTLFGHEWSFAYQHMARAVANVLNYLEAQRA